MEQMSPIFEACGPWMYLLLVGQIMVIAVIVERSILLYFHYGRQGELLLTAIEEMLSKNELERARKLASAIDIPTSHIVRAALELFEGDPSFVKDAATEAVKAQAPLLKKRIGRLAVLGLTLALIGAMGTFVLLESRPAIPALVLPHGLPVAWAPALSGGISGLIAILFAGGAWIRASQLLRCLESVPTRMSKLAWARADAQKKREMGFS